MSPCPLCGSDRPLLASALTPRELDVLAWAAVGKKNREIAECLGVRVQVVKNYLRDVYRKLQVRDRVALALLVIDTPQLATRAADIRRRWA